MNERLEEGLHRLREMGYLRSPGELYVARKIGDRRHSGVAAMVVGVWTGGGAGILIGLLFTLSALLIEPGLMDRPSELAWLLFDLIGLGIVGGMILVTLCVWPFLRFLSTRPELPTARLQRAGALIPALLLALYAADVLARAILPRLAAAQMLTLLVICLIAGALGSMVSLGVEALLAVARLRVRGDWRPPRPRVSRRLADFAAISVASGLLVIAVDHGPQRSRQRLDQIDVPPPRSARPLLLLCIDGIDIDELREEALDSPDLLTLLGAAESVHVDPRTQSPASFWNEIATGFPESEHGLISASHGAPHGVDGGLREIDRSPVLSVVARVLLPRVGLGELQASDQRELLRPQLWEIAAHAGISSAAINWWASYPAARHDRLRVASDRWFLRLWESREDAAADSLLWSPESFWAEVLDAPEADLLQRSFRFRAERRAVQVGDSLLALANENIRNRELADVWSYATTADAFHTMLAQRILSGPSAPSFLALHLNGPDILQRRLRIVLQEAGNPASAARLAVELRTGQARFLAQLLRELSRSFDGDILLLIAHAQELDRERRLQALWLHGGEQPLPAQILDLAPIVLRRLGMTVAADMHGGRESDGLASYGLRPAWTPPGARHRIDLDRLRSLGYIAP